MHERFDEFNALYRRNLPPVCAELGRLYGAPWTEAPAEYDLYEATDVFGPRGQQCAVRIRGREYIRKYPGQFTITYSRATGTACEWNKLVERSCADLIFYGADGLGEYVVIDAEAFRQYVGSEGAYLAECAVAARKGDPGRRFRAYCAACLARGVLDRRGLGFSRHAPTCRWARCA